MNAASLNPTYERIRRTSVPINLLGDSGRLIQWLKKPGDPVEKYEPLATIQTADGVETEVTAALSGVVKLLMFHAGTDVQSGATLCYVQPASLPPPAPTRMPKATTLQSTAPGATDAPLSRLTIESFRVPLAPPVVPPKPLIRRSTLGPVQSGDTLTPVEELTMPDVPLSVPDSRPASARLKSQRRKTTHKTYHIEASQVARVKRLALELQLADDEALDYNESELVRAAIELLLELPRPALLATLRVNREREKQGCYGSGWPRPGKG